MNREIMDWRKSEAALLRPWGMKAAGSRGRAHEEAEHPMRSPYQRDRDRIIHCTAFRRLEYKTQVFFIHEGDYYRTRLTHTIEVAQIARTIARCLGLNEDLTEAISLAHDLGHTPFGHSGEQALRELMRNYGGYEHNRHGLRVVEVLESRYPGFRGLNLTWEVREGIIKHSSEYDDPDNRLEEFSPGESPTLESQVVNLADEIAYNSHDLDDGLKSGLITPRDLLDLAIWRDIAPASDWPAAENAGRENSASGEMERYQAVRSLINLLTTDLIGETSRRLEADGIDGIEAVRRNPIMVSFSPTVENRHRELKRFLMSNMYRHYRVVRMSEKAGRIIRDLFEVYVSKPGQMPPGISRRISDGETVARVVCDYIAGMTDNFALEEHRKLFDPLTRV